MKKYLHLISNQIQGVKKIGFVLAMLCTASLVSGQTVTPVKTVTTNATTCGAIDVQLNITGANPVARPLEATLVIDVSGSMGNTIPGDTQQPIDYAQAAAVNFINTFFQAANNPTGQNRIGIVTYGTTATIRANLTGASGQATLLSIINGLVPNSGNAQYTNIQDGIVKGDAVMSAGNFNCLTARSMIVLSDGVANRTGTGGSTCTDGTGGTCIQSAITAANNARTNVVGATTYTNQIFAVGLFGGIDGTDQTNATFCMNGIQTGGGAYITESGANLSGIYSAIFSQLNWIAQQISNPLFETETVSNNFTIVPGSITINKGTFTQTGQVISWSIPILNVETITLRYRLMPNSGICGNQTVSTSQLNYLNSSCQTISQTVTTPTYCVPCAPVLTGGTIAACYPTAAAAQAAAIAATSTPATCSGTPTLTASTVGTCSAVVTVTATNGCFTSTRTYNTRIDNTVPVLSGQGANATINCPAVPSFTAPTATDGCSGTPVITFTDVTTQGSPNCPGNYTVTRTWTATDSCGNASATVSQAITVRDNTAPTINPLPGPTTIANGATPSFTQAVANDGCSTTTLTFVDVPTTPNCNGSYSVTRTWTATDLCGNTATASQTINVSAAVIDAVNNTGTAVNGFTGGTAFTNVLINDTYNGVTATSALVTTTFVSSTHAGITLSGNNVVVAAGTPAGNYTLTYRICGVSATCACDEAVVSVVVTAPAIDAVNDAGASVNGFLGGTSFTNVLSNDTLNGVAVVPAQVNTTFVSSTHAGITLSGTNVVVAPGTPAGNYTLTYQICQILNPTNCDTAIVTVPVGLPVIDAVNDAGASVNGYTGGTSFTNVLVNDTLNGLPVVAALVNTTFVSSTNPGVTLSGTNVVVAPGTPAGNYTLTYQICQILNPTNCDTAIVTVPVAAPAIDAVNDAGASVNGFTGGTSFNNVLVNDTLNGVAVVPAQVNTTFVSSTHAGITLSGTNVVVAPGTPAGNYTLTYQICQILNPTNCDTAVVTVPVAAPVIDAVNDAGASVNGFNGGTSFTNVLVNDTLNGVAVVPAQVNTTFVSSTHPGVTLVGTNVVVAPGTPAGNYTLTYQICQILNPTNCDTAIVTVPVGATAINAVDDAGASVNGFTGGTSFTNVLINDTLNGVAVVPAQVNTTFVSSTHAGITLSGTNVVVAPGTPAGSYTLTYQICEILNPTNCDTAVVTVPVSAATIVANDDTGNPVITGVGGQSYPNVLINDTLNGNPATLTNVILTQVSTSNPGVTLNPLNGSVNVAPSTPGGTYTLTYQICEILNPTNCDTAIVTVFVQTPSINVTKDGTYVDSNNNGIANPGDTVHYVFVVTNTGNVPLTNVTITDNNATVVGGPIPVLAVGASDSTTFTATHIITQDDINTGYVYNLALATGTPPQGPPVTDTSNDPTPCTTCPTIPTCLTCTITQIPQTPSINVTKDGTYVDSNNNGIANPGDTVHYVFVVTNTGNVPLTNVTITDNNATVVGGPIALLAVGASDSTTFTATHIITQDDINTGYVYNLALATGTPPQGPPVTDTSNDPTPCTTCPTIPTCLTCTITQIPQTPSINVTKDGTYVDSNNNGIANPGDTVHYVFVVTNTGNVPLTNVTITDNNATVVGGPIALLAVGASDSTTFTATHIITQDDINTGYVYNLALATGTPPQGPPVTDTSNDPTPCTTCPTIPTCLTCTITQIPQTPSINVTKDGTYVDSNNNGIANPGDTVHYVFVVTNTGNVPLTNVTITDNNATVVGGPIALLAVGASDSTTFTATHIITQDDINTGYVYNLALATGTPPQGPPVTDTSNDPTPCTTCPTIPTCLTCTITQIPQTPSINVTKDGTYVDSNNNGIANPGDTVHYVFVVTNTGNVPLTNVTITDNNATVVGGPIALLAVGASDSTTFTATHIITQDDINTGYVYNLALATGTPPQGPPVTDTSNDPTPCTTCPTIPTCLTCTITQIPQTPSINVTKDGTYVDSNNNGIANPGDTVHYVFVVTNTGNVPLTNVTITDNNATVVGGPIPVLAVGASDSTTFTATHIITQDDINTGYVYNLALATGTPPQGPPVTDTSNDPTPCTTCPTIPTCLTCTITQIPQTPSINVTKDGTFVDNNNDNVTSIGDTIFYNFVVTNTGNVTLTNVTITDINAVVTGGPIPVLAVGASDSTTFTAVHVVTQADIDAGQVDNLATATGTPPQGPPVTDISNDPTPCVTCTPNTGCPTCTSTPLINAVNDTYNNVPCDVTGIIGNILVNDTVGSTPVNTTPASLVNLTILSGNHPNISISNTGAITVQSGIAFGSYTYTYQICTVAAPIICDQATVTINIVDNTPPTITVFAINQTVECDGFGNTAALQAWLANNGGAIAHDTCSGLTWSNNFNGLTDGCGETGTATVIFTATDASNNQSSTTATFTIVDTTAPTIVTPASNLTVQCDGTGNAAALQTWLNNHGGAIANDTCSNVTWTNNFTVLNDGCGQTGTATVTFVATDDCGNIATTTATFTIQDTTPPTLVTPASNATVQCDGTGNTADLQAWLSNHGGAIASDACSAVTWTHNFTALSDGCGATGVATVTFTATDECGNSTPTTATFTIEDTTPPTLVTPAANATIQCDGTGNTNALQTWLDNHGGAVATDICSGVTWTHNFTVMNDGCGASGTATVTFVATDACGNTTPTTATLTIIDNTPPVITTAAVNSTIECSNVNPTAALQAWLASNGGAAATDACSNVTWTNNFTVLSDGCGQTGFAVVTFTATDACGNSTPTTATFTIQDTTPPTITTAPVNATVQCDGAGNTAALQAWLASNGGAVATDACSGVTWTNNFTLLSDGCGQTGSATVTFTATDACGNSTSATGTFTIQDTTPPTITTIASNVTVQCDGAGNTAALQAWLASNGGASATDACSNVTWTNNFTQLSDGCGQTGSATVIFTATDNCDNSVTTTATFTIQDTTPPTITTTASDLTVQCDGTGNTAALQAWLASNGGAAATDICSGVTWTNNFTQLSDGCGQTGSATVIFTATDACGNTATTTATFTIQDTTAPVITTVASNTTVQCDGTGNAAALQAWLASNGGAAATDACSNVTWTNNFTQLSDGCGQTGSATVIFTATDNCGNTATTSATFTIQDSTPPVMTTTATNLTVQCDGNGNTAALQAWLASNGGASATDACSNVTWTNNFTQLNNGCGQSGSATVTFTATDNCGNTTTTTGTFTIQDNTPPTMTTTANNQTVQCDGAGNTAALQAWLASNGGASATDACSGVTWTNNFTQLSDGCGQSGSATVTFTATDTCGNTVTTSATFTIQDATAPTITTNASNSTIECNSGNVATALQAWLASNGGAAATDVCSNVTWTNNFTQLSDGCGQTGSATVVFTATDDCGNTATTSATFTVQDTIAPVLVGDAPVNVTVTCDAIPAVPQLTFADGCTATADLVVSQTSVTSTITSAGTYTIIRTWTVNDECGNVLTLSQTLNVTVPDYIRNLTIDPVCNIDITLIVDVADIINTQFPGVIIPGGTWTDVSNSGAFNTTTGEFTPLNLSNGNYIVEYNNNDPECPKIVQVAIPVDRDACLVEACISLEIHNAFTPNGDGINEFFVIDNITNPCYENNTVEIFNRWGVKVFDVENYNNVDRVFRGISEGRSTVKQSAELPTGTYFYILKYRNIEGDYSTKNGYLYLSR